MIIGDILTNPKSLENFSYFGDTRDTVNYLIWLRDVSKVPNQAEVQEMITTLNSRYIVFKATYIKVQEYGPGKRP